MQIHITGGPAKGPGRSWVIGAVVVLVITGAAGSYMPAARGTITAVLLGAFIVAVVTTAGIIGALIWRLHRETRKTVSVMAQTMRAEATTIREIPAPPPRQPLRPRMIRVAPERTGPETRAGGQQP